MHPDGLDNGECILVDILGTLCVTYHLYALIVNIRTNQISVILLTELAKYFWCNTELMINVSSISVVKKVVSNFYDKHSWVYDDRRGISRDTHNPSDRSQPKINNGKSNDQFYWHWKLNIGSRFEALSLAKLHALDTAEAANRAAKVTKKETFAEQQARERQEQKDRNEAKKAVKFAEKKRKEEEKKMEDLRKEEEAKEKRAKQLAKENAVKEQKEVEEKAAAKERKETQEKLDKQLAAAKEKRDAEEAISREKKDAEEKAKIEEEKARIIYNANRLAEEEELRQKQHANTFGERKRFPERNNDESYGSKYPRNHLEKEMPRYQNYDQDDYFYHNSYPHYSDHNKENNRNHQPHNYKNNYDHFSYENNRNHGYNRTEPPGFSNNQYSLAAGDYNKHFGGIKRCENEYGSNLIPEQVTSSALPSWMSLVSKLSDDKVKMSSDSVKVAEYEVQSAGFKAVLK